MRYKHFKNENFDTGTFDPSDFRKFSFQNKPKIFDQSEASIVVM